MKEDRFYTEKICRYCEKASDLVDESTVLCRKKGVVPEDSTCRSFRYDPLKRIPHRAVPLPQIDPDDMKL